MPATFSGTYLLSADTRVVQAASLYQPTKRYSSLLAVAVEPMAVPLRTFTVSLARVTVPQPSGPTT